MCKRDHCIEINGEMVNWRKAKKCEYEPHEWRIIMKARDDQLRDEWLARPDDCQYWTPNKLDAFCCHEFPVPY